MSAAAQTFALARLDSPLGELLLASDRAGRVRALDFATHEPRMHALLRRQYGADRIALEVAPAPAPIARALDAYFAGAFDPLDRLEVRTGGSEFQRRVWSALRRIPARETRSYGELARALGAPNAARAVGLANGANPIALIVPCHRVIGADGSLTGYGGGLPRKRWLLEHESKAGVPA